MVTPPTDPDPWTVITIIVGWKSVPLVPDIVTVWFPAVNPLHERLALPEPVMFVGLRVHDVLLVARATIRAKPLRAVIWMVEFAATPVLTVMFAGISTIEKSWN